MLERGLHLGHDVTARNGERPRRAIAQRDVQDRAFFGEVDRLTGEHPIAQLLDAGLARQAVQRLHRVLRDQVLRVIDKEVIANLQEEAVGSSGIFREQIAQMFARGE